MNIHLYIISKDTGIKILTNTHNQEIKQESLIAADFRHFQNAPITAVEHNTNHSRTQSFRRWHLSIRPHCQEYYCEYLIASSQGSLVTTKIQQITQIILGMVSFVLVQVVSCIAIQLALVTLNSGWLYHPNSSWSVTWLMHWIEIGKESNQSQKNGWAEEKFWQNKVLHGLGYYSTIYKCFDGPESPQ